MDTHKVLRSLSVLVVFGLFSSLGLLFGHSQNAGQPVLSRCVDDPNLAIKFFHVPPNSDVFMHPRVLQEVPANDPKLEKAPITESGYILYVTKDEINSVLQALGDGRFSWSVPDQPRSLAEKKNQKNPNYPIQTMRITATCPKGSAETEIPVKKMCMVMKSVEQKLRTKRALWEWKLYESVVGCPVSGFNTNEYPEARP